MRATRAPLRPVRGAAAPAVLVAAILLLALNLRGPIVAVSPVIDAIGADLGISAATAGLLTSLPVLCFGLAAPLAAALLARLGTGRGVLVGLGVLLAGILVRSAGGLPLALAGTLLIGLAITVGNVAVPVVIGRDLARRAGPVLGAYTAALNVGSMLTLTVTVPVAGALGWRAALAAWGSLVVAAAVLWWWVTRGRDERAEGAGRAPAVEPGPTRRWWRRPAAWALTAGFAGQAFSYYAVTAWLPALLADELGLPAAGAGAAAGLFQIAAVTGAFGVPVLLRWFPPRVAVLVVGVAWLTLPVGLLLAPGAWVTWSLVGGFAQGGGFTVIFALVVARSRDVAENRSTSAMVQGFGYTAAALGPVVAGAVREATGGWTAPLLVVTGALLLYLGGALLGAGSPEK